MGLAGVWRQEGTANPPTRGRNPPRNSGHPPHFHTPEPNRHASSPAKPAECPAAVRPVVESATGGRRGRVPAEALNKQPVPDRYEYFQ